MSTAEPGVATTTMRAARVVSPGRVVLDEVRRPVPGPGQVRVRLEGCGVCASNLLPWAGAEWIGYPLDAGAPGHEGWGVVDAVGEGVTTVAPGARVAALSYRAYAEYDLAAADQVVPIPDALGEVPVPGEPLGCAMNIFRRSEIAAGQVVAVVGVGFLGALLVQLARRAGAQVIAISRRAYSLQVAERMGADQLVALDEPGRVLEEVKAITGGRLCDRVIEATGKQGPLDLAGELTRERGRLVIAGYHQDGPRQVNMQLWNWRGLDVVNAHERDPAVYVAGMRAAIDALAAGALDAGALFTHRFPLERLGDALDATRDRPEGFLKALVIP